MKHTRWRVFWLLAAVLPLLACAEKLAYSRFEAVREGDSPETVEALLGAPRMKSDQTWTYSDFDRQITATVYFNEQKEVIGKEWRDPEHGMTGKSPHVNQPGDSHEVRMRETK